MFIHKLLFRTVCLRPMLYFMMAFHERTLISNTRVHIQRWSKKETQGKFSNPSWKTFFFIFCMFSNHYHIQGQVPLSRCNGSFSQNTSSDSLVLTHMIIKTLLNCISSYTHRHSSKTLPLITLSLSEHTAVDAKPQGMKPLLLFYLTFFLTKN